MPNTTDVDFKEVDQSITTGDIPVDISAMLGDFKMGPIGDASKVYTTSEQFQKVYGGIQGDKDDNLVAMRLLDAGSSLRPVNIKHYDDISDKSSVTAEFATVDGTNAAFTVAFTGSMTAPNTYTLAATGYNSVTAPFNTSAQQTVKDLLAKFVLANTPKVYGYQVYGSTSAPRFTITPDFGYTITGIALTGTGITATTPTALGDFNNAAGTPILGIVPLAPGVEYNRLLVNILPPSNGRAGYFNLTIELRGVGESMEPYQNLTPNGPIVEADQDWLAEIAKSSSIAAPVYYDLTGVTDFVPIYGARTYTGGTDGDTITEADYIGSSAGKTGFHALDGFDDLLSIGVPCQETNGIHTAGDTYARTRKDVVYFAHLSNDATNEAALAEERDDISISSSYSALFAGGLTIIDPLTGKNREISELGDVMGIAASVATSEGPYVSFAGNRKGTIPNALGPVNNFGTPGNKANLNMLAQRQINLVVKENNTTQILGNFTSQNFDSLLSFLNVRRCLIYVKGILRPVLKAYLDEPNTPTTWKNIYNSVQPFLQGLKDSEAIYGYRWEGDQLAKDLDSLKINKKDDVLKGKYKVKLFIQPTPAINEIEVSVIVSGSDISFEEAAL